ncbi:hypothetical protein [Nitrospira moscoviensis]|jgi:hypothetical protein|uniref:Uncharacterized protein n=1 Tax=Nitrospira moscoviensis TaxID=42253 RepID=A0A0K2G6X6_NITMO|nr:hypothetical protein [Nitrospira moscoviensis]ALA56703.1 exported protein of unknown function [Nitrospira moscoviensis]
MRKVLAQVGAIAVTLFLIAASQVSANAPAADGHVDYSGITGMYYTLIGLILAYGVYDTFLKKS